MKKFKRSDSRAGGQKKPEPPRGGGRSKPEPPGGGGRCVVGIHAVEELLNVRPKAVTQLWIRENFQDHPALQAIHDKAKKLQVRVYSHAVAALDRIVGQHQGVIGFASEEPEVNWVHEWKKSQSTVIALDEVEDPHNLGAVLRTAWLMGVPAVLVPERRSAQLSPAVSKVAQGAVEHVAVVADSSLPVQLEDFKRRGYWILGLSHTATQSIFDFEIPEKVVWVLGSEASGIRKSVLGVCDDLISIPQVAPNASYNVSVAAAIVLAETYRQRPRPISS